MSQRICSLAFRSFALGLRGQRSMRTARCARRVAIAAAAADIIVSTTNVQVWITDERLAANVGGRILLAARHCVDTERICTVDQGAPLEAHAPALLLVLETCTWLMGAGGPSVSAAQVIACARLQRRSSPGSRIGAVVCDAAGERSHALGIGITGQARAFPVAKSSRFLLTVATNILVLHVFCTLYGV